MTVARIEGVVGNKLQIDGSGKLLKAMTSYSKPDLESLAQKLGVPTSGVSRGVEKALTKPELYQAVYAYVSL